MNKISVVIIAKNAENTIKECLESLVKFNEVILYLNETIDSTEEIALNFFNVKIIHGEFFGFGETKNRATNFASNDWILSLDSDEILGESLVKEILMEKLKNDKIYKLYRINFYKNSQIKYCWSDDEIIRLYDRKYTQYTNSKVHEKIIINNLEIDKFKNSMNHYPYSSISDFIIKADHYSTLFAKDNVGKRSSSPTKAVFNGLYSFLKTYFFKRGFLDGYAGLIISFSHMVTNFYKYMKLYELNKEAKK